MALTVYVNDVLESTAFDITVNPVMNAIGSAGFYIPDVHLNDIHTIRDTWEALVDIGEIRIYGDSGQLLFVGTITKITGDRLLQIYCEEDTGKFTWYNLNEGATNFKLFEGKVEVAPVGTSMDVVDTEGEDPAFTDDEFNVPESKYLIVSDSTTSTSSKTLGYTLEKIVVSGGLSPAAKCWIGDTLTGSVSGATALVIQNNSLDEVYVEMLTGTDFDVTDQVTGSGGTVDIDEINSIVGTAIGYDHKLSDMSVVEGRFDNIRTTAGATYWWVDSYLDGTSNKYFKISLNYLKQSIPITATISKIVLSAQFIIFSNPYGHHGDPFTVDMILTDDEVEYYYTIKTFNDTFDDAGGDKNTVIILTDFEIPVGSQAYKYFNIGGSYYENGWIGFKWRGIDSALSQIGIKWYSLSFKIYYDTKNFEMINVPITDTIASKTITTDTNFQTAGVAENDSVFIGETMDQAFINLYTSSTSLPSPLPALVVNNGNPIGKGIASEYFGISGYKFLKTLCALNVFEFFKDYVTNQNLLRCLKRDDIALDGGVLTGFNIEGVETLNNKYGMIEVWWSGKSDGLNPATYPTGNDNPKSWPIIRKDILTYAEARQTAEDLAVKYANFQRSIPLKFSTWTFLQVGYLYDFTINGVLYEEQICRRATYKFINNLWDITGFFGGGQTPDEEWIGKTIGDLHQKITNMESIELTGSFMPANTWSKIMNKPLTFSPSAHEPSHRSGGSDPLSHDTLADISTSDHHIRYADSEAVAAVNAAGISLAATKTLKFNTGATVGVIETTLGDNDTSLLTGQGIKEAIEAAIAASSPPQIAFRGTKSAVQSIPNITWTKLTFPVEDYDLGGDFDSSTFTAPIEGLYHFSAATILTIYAGWSDGETAYMKLVVDGTDEKLLFYHMVEAAQSKPMALRGACDVFLEVGQEVEVWIYQMSGAAINTESAGIHTFFCGHLVTSEYSIAASTTRYYSLAPSDFQSHYPDVDDISYEVGTATIHSGSTYFFAPVHLPHGATVTEIQMYGTGGDTYVLYRIDRVGGNVAMVYGLLEGGAYTTISYDTIDNDNYAYEIRTYNMVATRHIHGGYIKYTSNNLYP